MFAELLDLINIHRAKRNQRRASRPSHLSMEERMAHLELELQHMSAEQDHLTTAVAALLNLLPQVIGVIQTETQKLASVASQAPGVDPHVVEASAANIDSVVNTLTSLVATANTVLNPPVASAPTGDMNSGPASGAGEAPAAAPTDATQAPAAAPAADPAAAAAPAAPAAR
ncbi:hypothetical protein HU675_0038455 [Bradyrhizobium septentrionale]|uniref:hypothetical protein n=1 Tax=Bradyrhizobium septentrionale TaxID=1404411 RepID=UPI0015967054|nr:hypothetical protein [Bradyrhizobium septentrionale]UGY23769.1 hypothetical protein HU675_0038455 [Bradyrhizobium septentrionale]